MIRRVLQSLAFIAVLFAWVTTASAQIVQTKSNTGTAVTTINVTTTATTAADGLIAVVRASAAGATTINTPSDSGGNTWATACSQLVGTGSNAGNNIAIFYVESVSAGVTTVTTTTSASSLIQTVVYEISGKSALWFDSPCSSSAADNTGTALAVPSFTPSTSNSLIIGGYSTAANKVFAAGTNYTLPTGSTQTRLAAEYRILTPASAQTAPATITVSGSWIGVAGAFKLSSNSPPTIVMNSTDTTTTNTLPSVEFTGSDTDGDDLTYEFQWSNNPSFTNAVTLGANQTTAASASIHPNPLVSCPGACSPTYTPLTWELKPQLDDRPFQAVVGIDGLLDHIDWFLGNDPNLGGPSGHAAVRVYAVYGTKTAALSVSGITRSGTTATATTAAPHGLLDGQAVIVAGAGQAGYNIRAQIAVTGASTFTYTVNGATVTPATGTITVTGGYAPLNAVTASLTPTHIWLAQSDDVTFSAAMPTANAWYSFTFTGAQRIRLTNGTIYGIEFDWVPDNVFFGALNDDNTLVVQGNTTLASYAAGNAYIDGAAPGNWGTRTDFVFTFRVYEDLAVQTFNSGTDAGFLNTVVGGDTNPFTQGQKIRYTTQSALTVATWWARARCIDLSGSNTWSSYTTPTRVYTIQAAPAGGGAGSSTLLLKAGPGGQQ